MLLSVMFMYAVTCDGSSDCDEESKSDNSAKSDNESEDNDDEYFPRTLSKVDPEQAYSMCKAALDEMAAHEGDVMYTRIGSAMEHVLLATRAQTLYLNGRVADSKEVW